MSGGERLGTAGYWVASAKSTCIFALRWFEDIVPTNEPTSQTEQDPMHGLKLVVKEEALPLKEQPEFPALAETGQARLARPGHVELQAERKSA